MGGAKSPEALVAAVAEQADRAHARQLAAARERSRQRLERLSRRRLSMAITFALELQRRWPEHDSRHGPNAAGDGVEPQDGQAHGGGEANQIHGTHGADHGDPRK